MGGGSGGLDLSRKVRLRDFMFDCSAICEALARCSNVSSSQRKLVPRLYILVRVGHDRGGDERKSRSPGSVYYTCSFEFKLHGKQASSDKQFQIFVLPEITED